MHLSGILVNVLGSAGEVRNLVSGVLYSVNVVSRSVMSSLVRCVELCLLTVWCSVVWCGAVQCGAILCGAVCFGVVHYSVVQCGDVWCVVCSQGEESTAASVRSLVTKLQFPSSGNDQASKCSARKESSACSAYCNQCK